MSLMTDSRQPGSVPTNKDDAAERAAASAEVPAAAGERGLSASSARALREELFGEELLDELMAQVDAGGLQLTG